MSPSHDISQISMQQGPGDIQSMISKIQQLEADKARLAAERASMSEKLEQSSTKINALTQKTQNEMLNKINTTIATWLEVRANGALLR